jgi:hypothetical protein
MKNAKRDDKTLCLNFCTYYRPGKNEELACRGYEVVARLVRQGRSLDFAVSDRKFDRGRAESLVERICVRCNFQKDGCDFMLDREAPPCGGFLLLARLLEAGTITLEDICRDI